MLSMVRLYRPISVLLIAALVTVTVGPTTSASQVWPAPVDLVTREALIPLLASGWTGFKASIMTHQLPQNFPLMASATFGRSPVTPEQGLRDTNSMQLAPEVELIALGVSVAVIVVGTFAAPVSRYLRDRSLQKYWDKTGSAQSYKSMQELILDEDYGSLHLRALRLKKDRDVLIRELKRARINQQRVLNIPRKMKTKVAEFKIAYDGLLWAFAMLTLNAKQASSGARVGRATCDEWKNRLTVAARQARESGDESHVAFLIDQLKEEIQNERTLADDLDAAVAQFREVVAKPKEEVKDLMALVKEMRKNFVTNEVTEETELVTTHTKAMTKRILRGLRRTDPEFKRIFDRTNRLKALTTTLLTPTIALTNELDAILRELEHQLAKRFMVDHDVQIAYRKMNELTTRVSELQASLNQDFPQAAARLTYQQRPHPTTITRVQEETIVISGLAKMLNEISAKAAKLRQKDLRSLRRRVQSEHQNLLKKAKAKDKDAEPPEPPTSQQGPRDPHSDLYDFSDLELHHDQPTDEPHVDDRYRGTESARAMVPKQAWHTHVLERLASVFAIPRIRLFIRIRQTAPATPHAFQAAA